MTEAATVIQMSGNTDLTVQQATLSHTTVFVGGTATDLSGGITLGQADARYVQLAQVNVPNGVAGLDAGAFVGEPNLPLPPVDLTVLLENKLA